MASHVHVAVPHEFVEVKTRIFAVPIVIDEKQKDEAAAVRIFVSANRGKTWKKTKECKPTEKEIDCFAEFDDLYWFAVQVVKKDGTTSPAEEKDLVPALKVNVNTTGKAIAAQESWQDRSDQEGRRQAQPL